MSLGKKKMLHQAADSGVVNTDNFAPVTYTGNGSTQSISTGFQPDLVWAKQRTDTFFHILQDSVRGEGKTLFSNATSAESGNANDLISSFDTNGFTVNRNYNGTTNNDSTNGNSLTYVAWCWKAGGAAVLNTDGSITSSVSANQDAGFSIVKYTGNNTAGATIGHGLSSAPDMIIVKNLDTTDIWTVQHSSLGYTKYIDLNSTNVATTNSSVWYAAPTSSVFSFGANPRGNGSGNDIIAYCFHSVDGYQKVGSYSGSNSPISITTGFQPRFLLTKRTDASGNSWVIIDSAREIGSGADALFPDLSVAESSGWNTSFDSNGFTISSNESYVSAAGGTYIYLAIA